MSKIGKQSIAVPSDVQVSFDNNCISVSGPKGKLKMDLVNEIECSFDNQVLSLKPKSLNKKSKEMWGLSRSLVNNMVQGVKSGFTKKLEINGVGYKASVDKDLLMLSLGYSHEIAYPIPKDIEVKCINNVVEVCGFDKQLVGQVAADIRSFRKPEPYKGKGIKYSDEIILRKEGKKK